MAVVKFTLNGQAQTVDAIPAMPLLWVLRDTLGLEGTKFGCGMALCGACTVHVNGSPTRSCMTPMSAVAGKTVVTIEGLSADRSHPCQQAWIEEDVPQCGYCQSGQIMTAAALLSKTSTPTDADIDEAMRGNICRCGAYDGIRRAIHRAGELKRAARRCAMSRATMNRRAFLGTAAAAAGGLLVRFRMAAAETAAPSKLNAFIYVGADDSVLLYIHKAEMGQGTVTSLSMLLAEELECDWKKIRTDFPGISREFGGNQGVVGSGSIRSSWESLRRAGATAREMLKEAAAQKWGVDRASLRAENSFIVNPASGARLSYGSLAEAASKVPPPAERDAQGPQPIPDCGQSHQAPGYSRQSGWQRGFRHRRAGCPECSTPWWRAARYSAARWRASMPPKPRRCRASRAWCRFRAAWPCWPIIPGQPWKAGKLWQSSGTKGP